MFDLYIKKQTAALILLAVLVFAALAVFYYKRAAIEPAGSIREDVKENNIGGRDAAVAAWGVYRNPEWGFEVKYPPEYEVQKYGFDLIFLSPDVQQCIVKNGDTDECKASSPRLGYYFSDVYFSSMTFEEWVNAMKRDGAIEPDEKIEDISVDGIAGYAVQRNGIAGKQRDVYFLRDADLLINFSIPIAAPQNELAAFDKILNTLRYTKKTLDGGISRGADGHLAYRNDKWGFELKYPGDYKAKDNDSDVVFLSPAAQNCLNSGGKEDVCELDSPRAGYFFQDEFFGGLSFEQWIVQKKQDGAIPAEATLHNIIVGQKNAFEIGMNGPDGKKILNIFVLGPDNRLVNFHIRRDSKEIGVFDQIVDSVIFIK